MDAKQSAILSIEGLALQYHLLPVTLLRESCSPEAERLVRKVQVRLDDGTLTVADQGPGIDAADLPHVFDRFYRSSEARTLPGSGLGLSIVRRAADRHGAP